MLKNYGELLAKLLGNLKNGSADVSFMECLQIMGNGILLMAVVLLMLAIIVGLFWFPIKGYNCFTGTIKATLYRMLMEDETNETAIAQYKKSLVFRKSAFFVILTVFYVPVCIPTVLYLLSLLIH